MQGWGRWVCVRRMSEGMGEMGVCEDECRDGGDGCVCGG